MRVFPISNWTEMDVWMYIEREALEVPSIYFAHRREVFMRSGMYFAASEFLTVRPDERVETLEVRYRTVGDMTSTGAIASPARTVADVIMETAAATISERGAGRADDTFSETAMEDRKREGYFLNRDTVADTGRPLELDLLRFTTVGSVDDGKSTLVGRLLYETKQIFDDQLTALERASNRRGRAEVDLALLMDGLRSEREQGITIDVAYRYFATRRRKFIIADTPGHVQYTRNMVTGASKADLAVILVDARTGVVEQTRRHAFVASLLRVPHFVIAINKMDLVGYDEDRYERIVADFGSWASRLDVHDVQFIPISALHGDNVVRRSDQMPWYDGPTLLYHLERSAWRRTAT